jgi:serine/threonine-protein kinase SRPK3
MEGIDLTKAVLNKGKQMASVAASAANGNGGKKRRKATDLKPIVTNDAKSGEAGEATES